MAAPIGMRTRFLVTLACILALVLGVGAPAHALEPLEATPTPTIEGEARVGVALTAVPGIWRPAPVSLTYQWFANGRAVSGANRTTFAPTAAMVGQAITVRVTGTKTGFTTAVQFSAPTDPVLAPQTMPVPPTPTITGAARVGITLIADPGTWAAPGTTFTYRWYVGLSAQSTTTREFLVPSTAVGKTITVRVTGTAPGYRPGAISSAPTAAVVKPLRLTPTPAPRIVGTPRIGDPLHADLRGWGPAPLSYTFQWYADGKAVTGATTASFTPAAAHRGKKVTVAVTGTKPGYLTARLVSAATAQVGAASPLDAVQVFSVDPAGEAVSVAWAPSDDATTGYRITAVPVAGTATTACPAPAIRVTVIDGASTGATVGDLCAGVAYTFSVAVRSGTLTGPAGPASVPVVPLEVQVPEAPLIVAAIGRDGEAIVTWTPPAYDGGLPVTGYRLTASADGIDHIIEPPATATDASITGLVNGTDYALTLVAINVAGDSVAAPASVVPSSAYLPGAPAELTARPDGSGGVQVAWGQPIDDGGSPITGYLVSWVVVEQDAVGDWHPIDGAVVDEVAVAAAETGLHVDSFDDPFAAYRFEVRAVNAVGSGDASVLDSPVTPTVQIDADVVVLELSTITKLLSATPTVWTWASPFPAQARALVAGDVIVAPSSDRFPGGALLTVEATSRTTTRLTITVRDAVLTEAFSSGSMSAIVDPLSPDPAAGSEESLDGQRFAGGEFVPTMPGVQIAPDFGGDLTLSNSDTFTLVGLTGKAGSGCSSTTGSCLKFSIGGSVNIKSTASIGLTVTQNFVGIPDGLSVSASAKVQVTSSISASISGEQTWKVGEIVGAPVTVMVGPVPLIFVPKIPIYLTASGNVAVGLSASQTVGAKVSWSSKDAGNLKAESLNTPLKLDGGPIPGLTATGKASLSLSVEPTLALYSVAGPVVTAEVSLTADINFLPGPGQSFLTITPKFTLSAGLSLDQFGQHLKLTATLFASAPGAPFKIGTVPSAGYTITTASPSVGVGQSATFTANRSEGSGGTLTWSVIGGVAADKITTSGVFTAGSPAGRTVTIAVVDSTGASGQTTITIGASFDPPRGLTSSPGSGPGVVALAWTAPANTGGSSISSYRVSVVGGATLTTTTRSATVTGLVAGISKIEVRAVNAQGVSSAPASLTVDLSNGGYPSSVSAAALGPVAVPYPDGYAGTMRTLVCGSDTTCIATGGSFSSSQHYLIGLHDDLWTATIAPVPSDGVVGSANQLHEPRCSAADVCSIMTDYELLAGGYAKVLEIYRGGVWTATRVPEGISSVTCLGSGECIGVGHRAIGEYGAGVPLVSEYRGGSWHEVAIGTLPDADPAYYHWLGDVACSEQGTCVASGHYIPLNGGTTLSLATRSGGVWTLQKSPMPADAKNPGGAVNTTNKACGGGTCVIGGTYLDSSTRWRGYLMAFSNGRWRAISAPTGSDASTTQLTGGTGEWFQPGVYAVDCPTTTMCSAVGIYGVTATRWKTVVYDFENGIWTWAVAPLPERYGDWGSHALWCEAGRCVYQSWNGMPLSHLVARDGSWQAASLPGVMSSCTATLCRSGNGSSVISTWSVG